MKNRLLMILGWLLLAWVAVPVGCKRPNTPDQSAQAETDLTDPASLPPELRTLRLSKMQAAKIDSWLKAQGKPPNPAKYAAFLDSVLRSDQKEALHQVINSGGR